MVAVLTLQISEEQPNIFISIQELILRILVNLTNPKFNYPSVNIIIDIIGASSPTSYINVLVRDHFTSLKDSSSSLELPESLPLHSWAIFLFFHLAMNKNGARAFIKAGALSSLMEFISWPLNMSDSSIHGMQDVAVLLIYHLMKADINTFQVRHTACLMLHLLP